MASFSPFDVTLWYATAASAPLTKPLSGRIKADICIVGAGYSGLTTALELARAGVDVVLLERQEIGFEVPAAMPGIALRPLRITACLNCARCLANLGRNGSSNGRRGRMIAFHR